MGLTDCRFGLEPLFLTFGKFLAQLFKNFNVVHVGVAGGPLSPPNRRGPLDAHEVRTPVAGGPLSPPEVNLFFNW